MAFLGLSGGRGASDRILGLIEATLDLSGLAIAEIDAIAVTCGPGSLTGLRVGIGTARGIATGADKPLVGVSTLQALAAGLGEGLPVLALIDAGRGEVYGGLFQPGDPPRPAGEEQVGPPEAFVEAVRGREVRIAGSGAARYAARFGRPATDAGAGAAFVALGAARVAAAHRREGAAPLDPSPRYIRRGPAPVRFAS